MFEQIKKIAGMAGAVSVCFGVALVAATAVLGPWSRISCALVGVELVSILVCVLATLSCLVWGTVATFRSDLQLSRHLDAAAKAQEKGSVECAECGRSLHELLAAACGKKTVVRMEFVRGAWYCGACADALKIPASWREGHLVDVSGEVDDEPGS